MVGVVMMDYLKNLEKMRECCENNPDGIFEMDI